MIFDCPACGKRHSVPDNYDHQDFDCPNTSNAPSQKTFRKIVPIDQLTRTAFNMNRHSVLEDEARPITIVNILPSYRTDGTKIDSKRDYNY